MQIISDFVCFCLFWHVDGFVGLLCYVRQKRKSYQIYACKKCFWLKHSYVPQVCCGGFDSMVKASLSNGNFQRNNRTELELALLYDCLYVVSLFLFIYLLIFPFIYGFFSSLFLLLRLYILLVQWRLSVPPLPPSLSSSSQLLLLLLKIKCVFGLSKCKLYVLWMNVRHNDTV